VISDEIEIIEANAIQKTAIGNWPGARVQFERALMLEMPALRRAQILRNGRDVLEREFSAHGSGDGATSRRGSRLSGRDQRRSGEPQRRTSQHHYLDGTKTAHWDRLVRSRLYRRSLLGPQCREWSAHESNTHTRCPPLCLSCRGLGHRRRDEFQDLRRSSHAVCKFPFQFRHRLCRGSVPVLFVLAVIVDCRRVFCGYLRQRPKTYTTVV
jgi:hypothetical protein